MLVSAGGNRFHDILGRGSHGQQDHVDVAIDITHAPADGGAVEAGHLPVENRHRGSIRGFHHVQRIDTVRAFDNLMLPGRQIRPQYPSHRHVVVGNQDAHGLRPAGRARRPAASPA
jgi:hypothetical protein